MINIVCNRALLTAFSLDERRITGKIARAAIMELAGRGDIKYSGLQKWKKAIFFFSVLCFALMMVIFYRSGVFKMNAVLNSVKSGESDISQSKDFTIPTPIQPGPDTKPFKTHAAKDPESLIEPVRNLGDFLGEINRFSSRHMALKIAMGLWNNESEIQPYLDNIDEDQVFFQLAAKQNGLLIHKIEGNLNLLKKLNLPAILSFYPSEGLSPVYLTISKIEQGKIILKGGKMDTAIEIDSKELESYWSREAYIPWKNFLSLTGTIPLNSPMDSIITLKMLIRDIGFNGIEINSVYDQRTRWAVKEIQEKHGINVDALVGPLTKIVLYNENKTLQIPHIGRVSEN
ncbi:MAG: peptidoglycan-binding protein [Deltaproteobacteria bacterium]|nr:peptidoglycan-binding protein [Deltaproteobacteria bacterium]